MTTFIICVLCLYIIGFCFSLFRIYASICSLNYIDTDVADNAFDEFFNSKEVRSVAFCSWLGFFVGTAIYFEEKDKYFLKIFKY